MAEPHQYATEIARLHRTAAASRLRAVESQLSLAFTLCSIAETEIQFRRPDEALKVVVKLKHHAETIHHHLNEPNHLPRAAISDLRKELAQLKRLVGKIESRLQKS